MDPIGPQAVSGFTFRLRIVSRPCVPFSSPRPMATSRQDPNAAMQALSPVRSPETQTPCYPCADSALYLVWCKWTIDILQHVAKVPISLQPVRRLLCWHLQWSYTCETLHVQHSVLESWHWCATGLNKLTVIKMPLLYLWTQLNYEVYAAVLSSAQPGLHASQEILLLF